MFSKGFPARMLGRLCSVALLFVATSVAFSSLAVADYVVPAQKTDWIYFDLNWTPQEASPCLSTDIAMANAVIASENHCEASFLNWTAPWQNGEGITPWTHLCVAPGIPPEKEHWQRMEARGFRYKYRNICPGTTEHTGTSAVWGHFYYFCADSENYDLFRPTAGTVACLRKPGGVDPDKPSRADNCCNVGNPINVALGQKYQREADYPGTPLRFERHYWNRAWRTTYSRNVQFIEGTAETYVRVRRDDGQAFTFQKSGANYVTNPDVESKLARVLDGGGLPIGWRYTDEEHTVELYDTDGRLTSITTRSGLAQTLAYDVNDRLATVTDSFGKQLTFGYDGGGRLATLTDPAGGVFQYGYDANGDLATLTAPDLSVRTYLYNEAAHTGGADLPHTLTGIIDENNDRFATFKYDASGRAVQTEHAGGADRMIVAYNADGTRTITDAFGTSRTMTTILKQGVRDPPA
jgi:YD repeat-containing protein